MSIIKVDEIQGSSGGSSVTISGHKPTVPFDLNANGSVTPHDALQYLKWSLGVLTDFNIPTSKTTQAPWTNTTTFKSALVEGNYADAQLVAVSNPSNNYGDTFILGNQDANYNLKSGLSVSGHSTFLVGGADGEVKLYKLNATTGDNDEKLSTSSTGISVTGNLKIATAGGGIDFSATSDATGMTSELLDDYEEGTFSVSENNGSGVGVTLTEAQYTKIGRTVHIYVDLAFTGSTSGVVSFSGLPYTASAAKDQQLNVQTNVTSSTPQFVVQGANLITTRDNATQNLLYSHLDGKWVRISGTYQIA